MATATAVSGDDLAGTPQRVSAAQTPKGFRLDIQGIRGLALVIVLACHAELSFIPGGFVGLDAFFVLSGFLITGMLVEELERRGRISLLKFYARRARRLLPLAATVLAAVVVGALLFFGPVRAYETSHDVIAATLYFANWHFIADSVDYFAFDRIDISPIQHYWSLSVEEQFYVLWPLLLMSVGLLARRVRIAPRRALLAVVLVLTAASIVYGAHLSDVDAHRAYFSSLARGWELSLGGALALVLPKGLRMPRLLATALSGAGLGMLIWTALTLTDATPYPGLWALAPALGTAAIIVAGTSTRLSPPVWLLTLRPLQSLGKISYAWYLWHWPALVFAAAAFGTLTTTQRVVVIAASWVPTIITHYAIEERFRHSRTLARLPRRAVMVGAGCSASVLAFGIGLGLVQTSVPTAAASAVEGAHAMKHGKALQRKARAVRPNPRHANSDRGPTFADGCHLRGSRRVRSPGAKCVFGKRSATNRTVVLIGDSHGLMYAPALLSLANQRKWRLVELTRAGCTIADVVVHPRCDEWRENSLRRIARARPKLVVVSNGVDFHTKVVHDGKRLSRDASERYLIAGFARSLRRIRRSGAKVAVIRDIPKAPIDVPDCVAGHLKHLRACAFRPHRKTSLAYDARGARRVRHVRLIDPLPEICPDDLCPAVIGNALVWRNNYHLSATFTRTLDHWLGRRLPRLGHRHKAHKRKHRHKHR